MIGAFPVGGAPVGAHVAGAGQPQLEGTLTKPLGNLTAVAAAVLFVSGSVASSIGPIAASGAATNIIRASAAPTLGPIAVTAAAATPVEATAAVSLGPITTTSSATLGVEGAAMVALAPVTTASAGVAAVRGTATVPIGAIVATSSGTARIAGQATPSIGPIGCIATATKAGQDLDPFDVASVWLLRAGRRVFVAPIQRRSFIIASRGRGSMIEFPGKYTDEVRNAAIDFASALATGETLTGTPTAEVARGDMTVSGAAISGTQVRFRLSGGTSQSGRLQTVSVRCSTSEGQVLEEDARVKILA